MTPLTPIVRAPGEGDRRAFLGGGLHTWKLMTEDTGGTFFMFEDLMTRGKTTPLHRHPEADETVYVLEGEVRIHIAGTEHRLRAGGITFTPKGTSHGFLVCSDRARLLTVQTPGTGQAFYRDASEPAAGDLSDAVDIARVGASAGANPSAIELVGPPPFAEVENGP